MATQVQLRRGNTTQTNAFTGAVAEITVDTDKNTIIVHDGSTAGGIPLAKESTLNDAFVRANNSLNANTGGEVTANVTISANLTASNVATQTYIQFGDGTKQFTASTDTDQYSRNTANAAFIHANSSFDFANTISGGSAIDNVARALANSATSTNITQNNSIAAAFTAANSAGVYANSAFDAANTTTDTAISAGVYANGAFDAANTATATAIASEGNALAFAIALG
jgi:hypothetical protein